MRNRFLRVETFVLLSAASIFVAGCGNNTEKPAANNNPAAPATAGSSSTTPETPAAPAKPQASKPKLADLKFTLPEGWEAMFKTGSYEWEISKMPNERPTIYISKISDSDYPMNLDDFVEKLKTEGDHFQHGLYWDSAADKGDLPDGYYVVGKVKLKSDKEAKDTGLSVVRDIKGLKVVFECFRANDDKERQEALDICKSATPGSAEPEGAQQ